MSLRWAGFPGPVGLWCCWVGGCGLGEGGADACPGNGGGADLRVDDRAQREPHMRVAAGGGEPVGGAGGSGPYRERFLITRSLCLKLFCPFVEGGLAVLLRGSRIQVHVMHGLARLLFLRRRRFMSG
jgi:hypothetical protein